MTVQLEDIDLKERMLEAAEAVDAGADATPLAASIVDYLARNEALEVWARHLANHYHRANEWEEFQQVIAVGLIEYLSTRTLAEVNRVATPKAHLFYRAKSLVTVWLDSPAVTVASEMSGKSRRFRLASSMRKEFISTFNREPSDAEVVEYANRKAIEQHGERGASKRGLLLTVDDVSGQSLTPYSTSYARAEDDNSEHADALASVSDEHVQVQAEATVTVRQIADLGEQMFGTDTTPSIRVMLAAWMDLVLVGEPVTIVKLAEQAGVSTHQARKEIARIDQVLAAFRERHSR